MITKPRQFLRLFYINYVLARRGVDRIVLSAPWFAQIRFIAYFNPWNWFRPRGKTRGEALRLALEDLGPIFVKFGQLLSTRYDLLPDDMIAELEKLQDRVPPFPSDVAQAIVEDTFHLPLSSIFAEFTLTPIASASIAQVHTATLHSGQSVVVKIRRPTIEKIIQRDLGLLYMAAKMAERFWSHGRRLHLRDLVREFEYTILDELDFMNEAANASQLRRNFAGSNLIYVPKVYWDYTTSNVFVMERINGIPIADMDALKAANVDLKKLSENGVEIFFTQVFRDSFFHADMHPGNIFVSATDPQNPTYMAVDFGIMGSLSPTDQHYLAENLLAFFKRDYRRVATLHVESGWVPPNTRVDAFESAIRSVCEPIFERPLRDISFGQLLLRLFQTAGRFHMEVQPQLFLLQKTLLHIEGLGRRLYPDLDLWATAKPYLERWMRKRHSPRALMKHLIKQGPAFLENLAALPPLCYEVLQQQKKANMLATFHNRKRIKPRRKSALKYFLYGVAVTLIVISCAALIT